LNLEKQAINGSTNRPSKAFPALGNDKPKIALIDGRKQYSYAQLNQRIDRFANGLLAGQNDLNEAQLTFLLPAGLNYVTTLFGI
jgi:non-ribosomal peptide synthetase component E (peptide arylation enzyme)